MYRLK